MPFTLLDLDDGGRDGPIMAELMPWGLTSITEDDLIAIGRVAAAAIAADGRFSRVPGLLSLHGASEKYRGSINDPSCCPRLLDRT